MEPLGGIVMVIGQVIFFGVMARNLFGSAVNPKLAENRWMYEIIVTILTLLCFSFVKTMRLQPEFFPVEGFNEYAVLTMSTLFFYWFGKTPVANRVSWLRWFCALMLGAFSLLALFTAFKFILIFPLMLFPFFGFLVAAPYFAMLMGFTEIFICYKSGSFMPGLVLIASCLFLCCFQLIMNSWTGEPWQLVRVFNPDISIF